eukprot:TRINITY_DN931_c0_g1_i2.p1 TRINITY_DN931_c0_g1~~TRINITY_DN931_c0_g1_i2.p1  ORF type:complete len:117 (+),score=34.16 TRINITY_DN931_c0_g1_i2:161-511(+)
MGKFGFVLRATVKEGKNDEAIKAIDACVAFVKANFKGVPTYSLTHDGEGNLTFVEIYDDDASFDAKHKSEEFGKVLGSLLQHIDVKSCEVFGEPSDDTKAILNTFGAKYLTSHGWL